MFMKEKTDYEGYCNEVGLTGLGLNSKYISRTNPRPDHWRVLAVRTTESRYNSVRFPPILIPILYSVYCTGIITLKTCL